MGWHAQHINILFSIIWVMSYLGAAYPDIIYHVFWTLAWMCGCTVASQPHGYTGRVYSYRHSPIISVPVVTVSPSRSSDDVRLLRVADPFRPSRGIPTSAGSRGWKPRGPYSVRLGPGGRSRHPAGDLEDLPAYCWWESGSRTRRGDGVRPASPPPCRRVSCVENVKTPEG